MKVRVGNKPIGKQRLRKTLPVSPDTSAVRVMEEARGRQTRGGMCVCVQRFTPSVPACGRWSVLVYTHEQWVGGGVCELYPWHG